MIQSVEIELILCEQPETTADERDSGEESRYIKSKGGSNMFSSEEKIEAALATMTAGDVVGDRQLPSEVRKYIKGLVKQYFAGEFELPVTVMVNGKSRFKNVPKRIKDTIEKTAIWSARENGRL